MIKACGEKHRESVNYEALELIVHLNNLCGFMRKSDFNSNPFFRFVFIPANFHLQVLSALNAFRKRHRKYGEIKMDLFCGVVWAPFKWHLITGRRLSCLPQQRWKHWKVSENLFPLFFANRRFSWDSTSQIGLFSLCNKIYHSLAWTMVGGQSK